jgi:hypothetical protein
MENRSDETLDRYSLKERLKGFSLPEVLSLFDPNVVQEHIRENEGTSAEAVPPQTWNRS